MPVDGVDCEYVISTDYWLVYDSKYYLKVYLDNSVCKFLIKKMLDYFDEDRFGAD